MKKIGILVNSIGYGGNERSAVNVAQAISGENEVSIITQEDCGNHYGFSGQVINLNTPCARTLIGKVLNSLRRIVRLKKIMRKMNFDTIFIILPVTNPINYMHFSCRKVVSCRDCGDLIKNIEKYKKMTEASDCIVCNSKEQADYLVKHEPLLESKVKVIYNIIDISKIAKLKEEEIDIETTQFMTGKRCIVSAGRLANAKGINNLVKAFAITCKIVQDMRLIIIGDGELREKIKNLVAELGINEKVLMLGFQENPFKYITHADAFILTSFYEGFPNMLIEAMACGKPVFAADCPSGPAEMLCGNAGDGYVVTKYGVLYKCFLENNSTWDANDIRDEHYLLANALLETLTNKSIIEKLSNNAVLRANDFTKEKIANEWLETL